MMSTSNNAPYSASLKAEILSEALPYIRQFHGRTVVVKYGGNAMTDEQLQRSFALVVCRSSSVGPNPVWGTEAAPQITKLCPRGAKGATLYKAWRAPTARP